MSCTITREQFITLANRIAKEFDIKVSFFDPISRWDPYLATFEKLDPLFKSKKARIYMVQILFDSKGEISMGNYSGGQAKRVFARMEEQVRQIYRILG